MAVTKNGAKRRRWLRQGNEFQPRLASAREARPRGDAGESRASPTRSPTRSPTLPSTSPSSMPRASPAGPATRPVSRSTIPKSAAASRAWTGWSRRSRAGCRPITKTAVGEKILSPRLRGNTPHSPHHQLARYFRASVTLRRCDTALAVRKTNPCESRATHLGGLYARASVVHAKGRARN